jgi:hypothetical protein
MRALRVSPMWALLRWTSVACAGLALGCQGAHTPPAVSAAADQSLPVPYDLQEAVEEASILGTHLFLLDAATARATQALSERIGPLDTSPVRHYLAVMGDDAEGKPDGSVLVLFFEGETVPVLTYRVQVSADPRGAASVTQQDPPGVVHEPLTSLLNARWLALEAVPRSQQGVSTVLMPQRNGNIVVYVLGATRQPNTAVLGRHFRVEVAEDGAQLLSVTALSKDELELPTRDRAGQRLAALAITDGDVDHPTETHVLASRLANVPIYVTTGRGRWKVRATGIDYLGPR